MTSIIDSADNTAFQERVRSLAPGGAARWGKMDVAQMLAHCRRPLELGLGERSLKRGLVGRLFGGFFRKRLVNGPMPFRPNLPTDPGLLVVDRRDFAVERERLLALLDRYRGAGADVFTRAPHPFFGRMTPDEWDRLLAKHLEHHLRQFGV